MSSYEFIETQGVPIKSWTIGVPVEVQATQFLLHLTRMRFVASHIAVLPNVYCRQGVTTGAAIVTRSALIPGILQGHAGQGTIAMPLHQSADSLPANLHELREKLEKTLLPGDERGGVWKEKQAFCREAWNELSASMEFAKRYDELATLDGTAYLGTLGIGASSLFICKDKENKLWLVIVASAGNVGKKIGQFFIDQAKQEMQRWFINLPDDNLSYLPDTMPIFWDYLAAVEWCVRYGKKNRALLLQQTLSVLSEFIDSPSKAGDVIESISHQITPFSDDKKLWLTRNGAVPAKLGEQAVIAGSMAGPLYVVKGLDNVDSHYSCAASAGRQISVEEARRRYDLEDHLRAVLGVECRRDEAMLEETPGAYKNPKFVMAAQSDLVDIQETLIPLLCVKS
ncbi:MAG: RtcB family protein [Alphaproteobacteria bacterium]